MESCTTDIFSIVAAPHKIKVDRPLGRRPVFGGSPKFRDPHWQDLILFHEYYNGDNGAGLGISHQTGWAGLIAKLIQQDGEYTARNQASLLNKEPATISEEN